MNDKKVTIQQIKDLATQFAKERDWEQFHDPKNLSMSISIEAAELMEKFQFFTNEESVQIAQSYKEQVSHELADVLAYVLRFSAMTGIDLASTLAEKIKLNEKKYPIQKVKGNDYGKYTKLKK